MSHAHVAADWSASLTPLRVQSVPGYDVLRRYATTRQVHRRPSYAVLLVFSRCMKPLISVKGFGVCCVSAYKGLCGAALIGLNPASPIDPGATCPPSSFNYFASLYGLPLRHLVMHEALILVLSIKPPM